MNQFQRNEPSKSVEYGNPFDLLLDRAFRPQELKRAVVVPVATPETVVAIDVCAWCGAADCSCTPRRIVKIKI